MNYEKDFTFKEIEKICVKHGRTMKSFFIFMNGQTVSENDKGEIVYYGCDVERFIKRMRVID